MKKLLFVFFVSVSLTSSGFTKNRVAATKKTLSERREADVRKILDVFIDSWNTHTADKMTAIFWDQSRFTNYKAMIWKGRAEIIQAHAKAFDTIFKESVLSTVDAEIDFPRPDLALVNWHWHLEGGLERGTLKPTGPREGMMLMVVVKGFEQSKSEWRIHTAQNTDLPVSPR